MREETLALRVVVSVPERRARLRVAWAVGQTGLPRREATLAQQERGPQASRLQEAQREQRVEALRAGERLVLPPSVPELELVRQVRVLQASEQGLARGPVRA